jgi:hypothetical protein
MKTDFAPRIGQRGDAQRGTVRQGWLLTGGQQPAILVTATLLVLEK